MPKKSYPVIPPHIRVTAKRDYEVVRIDEFKDGKTLGECRWEPPQIVVKNGQSEKETFSTTLHELLHALSFEYDIALTETQVLKLEKGLLRLLLLNKLI